MKRILLIDDDLDWLSIADKLLSRSDYEVQVLDNGKLVVPTIMATTPDLVITDIMMPGITGGQVHGLIRSQIGPRLPVIVCSSTRLRFKSDDPRLAYCQKIDAPSELLPLVASMLESCAAMDSRLDQIDEPTPRNHG